VKPTVSVITPSFNQGAFIRRTIESVVSQDYPDLEYVVFDGGSTDETVAILREYSSRLRWDSAADGGQAHAVNKGLTATSGDIIGWLNSDDIYYPGTVGAVVEYLCFQPEVDVVYGDAYHIDEQDNVMEPYYTEPWDPARLREVCYLCQPAVFFRRRVVDRFGVLDERLRFCMDYEYWLRLACGGARFAHLTRVLAGSRLHPQTKTLAAPVQVHTEINNMTRARLGRVPDRWIFNYAHAVLESHGIRPEDRFRFRLGLAAVSLSSSLRWNRGVSLAVLQTTARWLLGIMRLPSREAAAR
jgi:glycosyltransferase involved in cell wall biosynthesis